MNSEHNPRVLYMLNDANWSERSRKLQERYPLLTDLDMRYEKGKEAELLSRMESRLNLTREDVISILENNMIVIKNT